MVLRVISIAERFFQISALLLILVTLLRTIVQRRLASGYLQLTGMFLLSGKLLAIALMPLQAHHMPPIWLGLWLFAVGYTLETRRW